MNELPPEVNLFSPKLIAEESMQKYIHYGRKGYVEDSTPQNRARNKRLLRKFTDDPYIFWKDSNHRQALPDCLVRCATFILSIKSSSVAPEREFSRVGWMVNKRRSSITAENTDKRLTIGNLLPMKRKLNEVIVSRKLQKKDLFYSPRAYYHDS